MDMLDTGMPQLPGQNGKKGPDFREIISIVWRKKWLLLIPFVVCFVGGVAIARLWPKNYESESVLQFPRRGIEGEESIQDARFHQTKFRERAEQLQLKVRSSSTWMKMVDPNQPEYRSNVEFIDPDRSPSIFYRLKNMVIGGSEAPLHKQGLQQQVENIISNINVEISETDPSVRITCTGSSTATARDICDTVTKIFTEADSERLKLMNEKKEVRQAEYNKYHDELKILTDRLAVLYGKQVSAQLIRYFQERLRNVSLNASDRSAMQHEARKQLYAAWQQWRRLPKEKQLVIDGSLPEGEQQTEQGDMLVRNVIAQYENYLNGLDKNAPDYARNVEAVKRELAKLRIQKAIEDKRIYNLMYLNILDDLEGERADITENSKTAAAEIKELLAEKGELLAQSDMDADSPQVKEIDTRLASLQRQALKDIDRTRALSQEIAVYRRIKRLLAAQEIDVNLNPEDEAVTPEEKADRLQDYDLSNEENYQTIKTERDEAAKIRDSLNKDWYDALEGVMLAYEIYRGLEKNIGALEAEKNQLSDQITKGDKVDMEIQKLEKDRAETTKKLEDARERLQSADDAINYIDRMVVFVEPTWSYEPTTNEVMIVLLVTFLGLVIGVGLVVITELTDGTVRSPRDLRALTRQPILAAIPKIEIVPELPGASEALFYRTKKQVEQDIATGAMFDGNYLRDIRFRNIATEQIRKLRNAMFEAGVGRETRPRTFLITSPLAGEGKSIVAANLAIAISQMIGEYVLLVDSDLRRPDQHNLFNLPPRPGLAEYLSDDIELADLLVKTDYDKLTLLQAGKVPANGTELLGSDKMWNLIKELRSRYDDRYILIDSPPIMSTSEPEVLAEQVDGIILVVRAGVTPREIVEDTISRLSEEKVIGIVMNDVRSGYARYYVPTYVQSA